MRKRAAEALNPQIGCMGAEDPPTTFPPAPRPSHTRCVNASAVLRAGFVIAAAAALLPLQAAADAPHVVRADLTGDINNIAEAYISNVVARADSEHASALLVVLNTPGGISTSMDNIVTSLLNAHEPVIVFVYPSGARAASAGLFVAQAADVLAIWQEGPK